VPRSDISLIMLRRKVLDEGREIIEHLDGSITQPLLRTRAYCPSRTRAASSNGLRRAEILLDDLIVRLSADCPWPGSDPGQLFSSQ
jgi:hypothetical protein